jgi:DNA replicative helicase MCM subunit Mcm2 (Cdc46/Mcm family)
MSLLINGDSSGGKSYLLKQLIKTLPPEMVVELQSVSNMGLAYMRRYALTNRFLALYELGGLGKEGSEAIEQLKQGLTEGRINIDFRATRMRRDYDRIMDLVEAHAVLHQESRDRGADNRIIATLEDYEAVYELIGDIVGEASTVTVSDTVRETVQTIKELIEDGEQDTRNTLAKRLKIVPTSAGRRFAPASGAGYVKEDPDNLSQRPKRYVLGDVPLPENADVIPSPKTLRGACIGAPRASGEGSSNKQRAPEESSIARSYASVRAPSDNPVPSTTQKPLTYGRYSDEPHDEKSTTGVSQNGTHERTIVGDEPETDEESNTVRASAHGSCAHDLSLANELAADGMYTAEEILDVAARLGEHFDDEALRRLNNDPSRLAAKVKGERNPRRRVGLASEQAA